MNFLRSFRLILTFLHFRANTLAIIGFHWELAFDFNPDYYIAAWKADNNSHEENNSGKDNKKLLL